MKIPDLTKEIQLQPKLQIKYKVSRAALHIAFLIVVLFVLYHILFPVIPLDFNINSPTALKNGLVSPRTIQTGQFPAQGSIKSGDTLVFNANPLGKFSKASITLTSNDETTTLEGAAVRIKKSYRAFFYPTEQQVGFKNGTLLTTAAGDYYIISNGLLRKFANTDIILKFGYPKSAFINVQMDDLRLNKLGDYVTDPNVYPDDTLFLIDNSYYQLKNQQLSQFISNQAFLSQFDPALAITKNNDFFSHYPLSQAYSGFADGTLASLANSVFILSENKAYPIENEVTFGVMGYDWKNVIQINADELGSYAKQKQFTDDNAHPNGTVFVDQETNKHFIIKDGKKYPIENTAVLSTYSKQKIIVANSLDAEKEDSCILKKEFLNLNEYSCEISLENLTPLIGNDYQISTSFSQGASLKNINATFSTPLTFNSLRNSLSIIKNKLRNR